MELTDEMIAYVYRYAEYEIRQHRIYQIKEQDVEDMKQYVIRKVMLKFRSYDPSKSAWKTYAVLCIKSALCDAYKWHYRQHQRMIGEPIEDHETRLLADDDTDPHQIIDDRIEDATLNYIAHRKYNGYSRMEIAKELGIGMDALQRRMDRIRDLLSHGGEETEKP